MRRLQLILADQLSMNIATLADYDKKNDTILMCEVHQEASYVKHHKKKIAFLFSAMRHFALGLKELGYRVDYVQLDDPKNSQSLHGEVKRAIKRHLVEKVIITFPGEYRILQDLLSFEKDFAIAVEIRQDSRFLCSIDEFKQWANRQKQLKMEHFYRFMRKKHAVLCQDDKPIGGKWNFDQQNRKPAQTDLTIPSPYQVATDTISKQIIKLVDNYFPDHFGDLEPFKLAVNREDALKALQDFIDNRLYHFGSYQDAMLENEPQMFHSHISFYLNCGLLEPLECIQLAEKSYHQNKAPLNSVEGFIRQILGWREYTRGVYWLKMPGYVEKNFFQHHHKLPSFYWHGNTKMNCLKQCIKATKHYAYAHHIQRLMVLGNFALLIFVDPRYVNEWFLIVYADAYEWVELPNVTGMALFADGGYLATKPYISTGAYINKMSNYCKNCHYHVKEKEGATACPFNYLYWNFLIRQQKKLKNNFRLMMAYKTLARMSDEKIATIKSDSRKFIDELKIN